MKLLNDMLIGMFVIAVTQLFLCLQIYPSSPDNKGVFVIYPCLRGISQNKSIIKIFFLVLSHLCVIPSNLYKMVYQTKLRQ